MHQSATKCNKTLGKWCKNKHGASKIMDTLETYQGQLLCHRLLQERNEGKLTLNSMITIASNDAAADDDARESLKASAIQNTGKQNNSNKWKNPPEEQQTPDMMATTFADKGQSSQRGKGRGASSGQPRSSTAPASAPSAPMSYDEYRDMPCFAHRDASGKCNHTNRNCKFVNDIKADQEAGYKRNRRQWPRGKGKADNGLVAKKKRTRIRSPRMAVIWTKTLRLNPPKRQRVGLARVTH
jgi:hypothetical protein